MSSIKLLNFTSRGCGQDLKVRKQHYHEVNNLFEIELSIKGNTFRSEGLYGNIP